MVLLAFILCGLAAGLACGGSLRAMAQHNIALLCYCSQAAAADKAHGQPAQNECQQHQAVRLLS